MPIFAPIDDITTQFPLFATFAYSDDCRWQRRQRRRRLGPGRGRGTGRQRRRRRRPNRPILPCAVLQVHGLHLRPVLCVGPADLCVRKLCEGEQLLCGGQATWWVPVHKAHRAAGSEAEPKTCVQTVPGRYAPGFNGKPSIINGCPAGECYC